MITSIFWIGVLFTAIGISCFWGGWIFGLPASRQWDWKDYAWLLFVAGLSLYAIIFGTTFIYHSLNDHNILVYEAKHKYKECVGKMHLEQVASLQECGLDVDDFIVQEAIKTYWEE